MERTLKITNVLSDQTRFHIYHYITNKNEDVTVCEIANRFAIHPNVARLHLTKLTDVNMLISETKKSGKGGRPSRAYRLSEELIQLTFPYRDYYLLSTITLKALMKLGEEGKQALYTAGKEFGTTLGPSPYIEKYTTFQQKVQILQQATKSAGIQATFQVNEDEHIITFQLCNCPFKECAVQYEESVCEMHIFFLQGIFESLFEDISFIQGDSMMKGCQSCTYEITVHKQV
jgi:predicted ArsR family transcriptional regulator